MPAPDDNRRAAAVIDNDPAVRESTVGLFIATAVGIESCRSAAVILECDCLKRSDITALLAVVVDCWKFENRASFQFPDQTIVIPTTKDDDPLQQKATRRRRFARLFRPFEGEGCHVISQWLST